MGDRRIVVVTVFVAVCVIASVHFWGYHTGVWATTNKSFGPIENGSSDN